MNIEGDEFFLKLKEDIDKYEKEKKAITREKQRQSQKARRALKLEAKQKYEEATGIRKLKRPTPDKRKRKQAKSAMGMLSNSPFRAPTPEPDMKSDFEALMLVNEDIANSISSKEKEEEEQFRRQQNLKLSWAEKAAHVNSYWREFRPTLLNYSIEMESFPNGIICQACCGKVAHICCADCLKYLCPKCDRLTHSRWPFHNRRLWKDNRFFSLQPLEGVEVNPAGAVTISKIRVPVPCLLFQSCPLCESRNISVECEESMVTIFHQKGQFQLYKTRIECNNQLVGCNWSKLATVEDYIRSGYWPDIPDDNFSTLFCDDVMRLWHTLRLACPELQERPFLDAMSGRVSHLYEVEPEVPVPVFARVANERTLLRHVKAEYVYRDNGACSACGSSPHMVHCDTIHELCREAAVSNEEESSCYGSNFFITDSKLLEHRNSIALHEKRTCQRESREQTCTSYAQQTFQTADSPVKLDQTGLAVASCPHGTVLNTANVYSGHEFASSHAIHLELTPKGIRFLSHDRICNYWPRAQKLATAAPGCYYATSIVQPALSHTHAETHSWPCQIRWNGLWKQGAGDTSGVENEKLRLYLARLAGTKNLSKVAREEAIIRACLFWNETINDRLPVSLWRRLVKAEKSLAEVEIVYQALVQKYQLDDNIILSLQKELEQIAMSHRCNSVTGETVGVSAEIVDVFALNRRVEELQLELNLSGQTSTASSNIVTGQGTTVQRGVKNELAKVVSLLNLLEGENYVTEEMIANGEFPWHGTCTIGTIMEQLEVVDSFNLRKRCQEELLQLIKEAKTYIDACVTKRRKLEKNIELLLKAFQNGGVIDSTDGISEDTFPYELETGHTEAFFRGHIALMHAEVARLDTNLARYGFYIKQKTHQDVVGSGEVESQIETEIVEIALPCEES